jgi:hypothetical protein
MIPVLLFFWNSPVKLGLRDWYPKLAYIFTKFPSWVANTTVCFVKLNG